MNYVTVCQVHCGLSQCKNFHTLRSNDYYVYTLVVQKNEISFNAFFYPNASCMVAYWTEKQGSTRVFKTSTESAFKNSKVQSLEVKDVTFYYITIC